MLFSTLPYELRIGVTGHRTLSDHAAVESAVRRLLDRIASTLTAKTAIPLSWTIVSSLARGADRIVTRTLLDRNGKLEFVAPFALDEYRKDFEAAEDRREFEALRAPATQTQELGPPPRDREQRDEAYLRAGERVVDVCEILIAVWNGRPGGGVGGTADVVRYAVARERIVLWINADRPDDPPLVIRSLNHQFEVTSEQLPETAAGFSPGYAHQAAYCADGAIDTARQETLRHEKLQDLDRTAAESKLTFGPLEAPLDPIVREFVRADALALSYQKKHTRLIKGVPVLAASAVTAAIAQVLFFPTRPWLILFEVAAMVTVLTLWWYGRHRAWHAKWLESRHLAERLRTATFTSLLGGKQGDARGDDPLPLYRGPQQWSTFVVASLARAAGQALPPIDFTPLKDFLITAWLNDQETFHTKTAKSKSGVAHRGHLLGLFLFATTLVMGMLHLLGVGHGSSVASWIVFLAMVLPVWAGVVHTIISQLELERIAERSDRMARALRMIAHHAGHARTMDDLRNTADDAATLMISENHEWWVLLSFQDVRLRV